MAQGEATQGIAGGGVPGVCQEVGWHILAGALAVAVRPPGVDRPPFPFAPVIISESAARSFFPDDDPIGQRIDIAVKYIPFFETWSGWRTVVGVVADVRTYALEERPRPQIYLSHEQLLPGLGGISLIARTREGIDSRTLADELKAVVRRVDPDVALGSVLSLEDLLSRQLGQR